MARLTRPEAVTLALFALGGAERAVDTEDVAVRVAALVPGMFSWHKYPERIDKEIVRVALSDARLKKRWAVGSHDTGWSLTPTGQRFAQRNEGLLTAAGQPRERARDERQHERERVRLLSSAAYLRCQDSGVDAVSDDEADAFFRINVYVEGHARERKIARIENQFGDDPTLGEAVRLLAARARERT